MSVEVRLTDSYYNMKEKILPHPELHGLGQSSLPSGGAWSRWTCPSGAARTGRG